MVDYRSLNKIAETDSYPLPDIHSLLDELAGAKWFGCLDLKSGFWQVPLASPSNELKTAFTVYMLGLYQYSRVPFGFKNAPSHFMRCVEQMLIDNNLRANSLAFIDDLCSHVPTWPEYLDA